MSAKINKNYVPKMFPTFILDGKYFLFSFAFKELFLRNC